MATANNLNELFKMMNGYINTSLNTDVKQQAVKTLKEHVVTDVYDRYDPMQYQRSGGLLQDSNVDAHMENENTLSVRSTRNENGKDIAKIIETGKGYTWKNSEIVGVERPFHKEAAKELDEKGLAKKALADGLRKQGLDVQ
jgi:hypothetical protein